ncbi:THUMP-like domain-containing protein [Trueperella sp. LYQ141]|uniref:class I SAM-dependent methyltransferase n=1 Tax=Trueperella sp. LYQ141 TaxID=3391058 RepID=UPI00398332DD
MISPLLTPDGRALLESLPPYDNAQIFALSARLREAGYHPELIAAALTQSRLRERARAKFGDFAERMFFTADGLEQATRLSVAAFHAAGLRAAGAQHIIDFGCGIGADSLAFAGLGLHVSSIEMDAETAAAASENLSIFPHAQVIEADGLTLDLHTLGADALWLDPARRTTDAGGSPGTIPPNHAEGTSQSAHHSGSEHRSSSAPRSSSGRILHPELWTPPLSHALDLAHQFPCAGIKVAPGIDYQHLPSDTRVEWVSVNGSLVEAIIWCGTAATIPGRCALIIDKDEQAYRLSTLHGDPATPPDHVAPRELARYIYEPDPAVIRAGGIRTLCRDFQLAPVASAIAYLTGDQPLSSPFFRGFEVIDVLPVDVARLRKRLQSEDVGRVEIKKRGIDLDPEVLRKKLRLRAKGTQEMTLIISPTISGQRRAILARRLPTSCTDLGTL